MTETVVERTTPVVKITATSVRPWKEVGDFLPVTVFGVEVTNGRGEWLESFRTKAELRAFLQGLQAGSQMTGGPHLSLPLEIPTP